jgi:hypothetical protein
LALPRTRQNLKDSSQPRPHCSIRANSPNDLLETKRSRGDLSTGLKDRPEIPPRPRPGIFRFIPRINLNLLFICRKTQALRYLAKAATKGSSWRGAGRDVGLRRTQSSRLAKSGRLIREAKMGRHGCVRRSLGEGGGRPSQGKKMRLCLLPGK